MDPFISSYLFYFEKKKIPFWASEIEPYSASSYSEVPQPSTRVPVDHIYADNGLKLKKKDSNHLLNYDKQI